MKKLAAVIAIFIFVVVLFACRKRGSIQNSTNPNVSGIYTCACSYTDVDGELKTFEQAYPVAVPRYQAEQMCKTWETEFKISIPSMVCKLK